MSQFGPAQNYQPPQYKATTRRRGQHLHGYATNHSGDWKPALRTPEYRENFDNIKWNRDKDKESEKRLETGTNK